MPLSIQPPPIVLCDWGTSRMRASLLVSNEIVAKCEGPGIGALTMPALASLIETLQPWRHTPGFDQVVACGMVGSRNGIVEVPYVQAPTEVAAWAAQTFEQRTDGLTLLIAAGIRGANFAGTPDVMRGEETQVFGALACDQALATGRHTLLLPGTHSKWVQLEEGRIVSVQTYITGELYGLLREHSSLLRAGDSGGLSEDGFAAGLLRSRESCFVDSLFETRAAQLIQARSRAWGSEYLSGLLIGGEIAAAMHARVMKEVVLIGESVLTLRYREALSLYGCEATCMDGDRCSIAGLKLVVAHHSNGH